MTIGNLKILYHKTVIKNREKKHKKMEQLNTVMASTNSAGHASKGGISMQST